MDYLKDALWLLSQYNLCHVHEEGFLRTFRILHPEFEGDIVNELIGKGYVKRCYYESNAYRYYYLSITEQGALELLRVEDKAEEIRNAIVDLIPKKWFRNFINWLGHSYWKAFEVWREEDVKAGYRSKYGDDLDWIINELVRKGILIIDYWPHRRIAGRRKSMPAHWELRLSRPASIIMRFWKGCCEWTIGQRSGKMV